MRIWALVVIMYVLHLVNGSGESRIVTNSKYVLVSSQMASGQAWNKMNLPRSEVRERQLARMDLEILKYALRSLLLLNDVKPSL